MLDVPVRVLLIEGMATKAVRLLSVVLGHGEAALGVEVAPVRRHLQVGRAHARPVAAQMIDHHALGDRPCDGLPGDAVGEKPVTVTLENAVALLALALPNQATGTTDALDVRQLLTNVYPLARIVEALETAAAKPNGFLKAVVDVNGE